MSDFTDIEQLFIDMREQPRSDAFTQFDAFQDANVDTRLPYAVDRFVEENRDDLNLAYPLLVGLDTQVVTRHTELDDIQAGQDVRKYHSTRPLETIKRTAGVVAVLGSMGMDRFYDQLEGASHKQRMQIWHDVDAQASDLFDWHKNL